MISRRLSRILWLVLLGGALACVAALAPSLERPRPVSLGLDVGLFHAFGAVYRHMPVEFPLCLHGNTNGDTLELLYATFPDVPPKNLTPHTAVGFTCLPGTIAIAHAHRNSPTPVPLRCMPSWVDRTLFLRREILALIILCDEGLLAVHWRDGRFRLCTFDPDAAVPECGPWPRPQ